jgi:arabinose-5-phosphate isomerase
MVSVIHTNHSTRLKLARRILRAEASALHDVANRLDERFVRMIDRLVFSSGRIVVTGVGKSAEVGRKITATLNSTGSKALFLDATAALHGDLGSIASDDVVLLLSHSGESQELLRLLDALEPLGNTTMAFTSRVDSTLAKRVQIVFAYGSISEADPLGLAPSSSTAVMMALGDALAFVLAHERGFARRDFARLHPAGNLGLQLTPVERVMRCGDALRFASVNGTIRDALREASRPGRRSGAILLIDAAGRLRGLFTDSDLARLVEHGVDVTSLPIREAMTVEPITIPLTATVAEAMACLSQHQISELPVVDQERRPVGLIDITDMIALFPTKSHAGRHAA